MEPTTKVRTDQSDTRRAAASSRATGDPVILQGVYAVADLVTERVSLAGKEELKTASPR